MDHTRVTDFDAAGGPDEEPDGETEFDESDDGFDERDDESSDDLEDDEDDEADDSEDDSDDDESDEDDEDDDLESDDEDDEDELVDAAAEADNEDEPDELIDRAAEVDNDEADEEDEEDGDETDFATVATGSSLEEAKRNALAQLRKLMPFVAESDIEYEVVDEAVKGGFLGRGRVLAKVEARVRPAAAAAGSAAPAAAEALPSAAEDLKVFIEDSVHLMGLEATVTVTETADTTTAEIGGDDLGLLIGRHGQTIDALQYLSAIAVNRKRKTRRQVVVDAEGYRERRNSSLHVLADRVAQRVARERTSVTLKPMTAAERKVIHLHLKDDRRVETVSEGQEPHRSVVIVPRERS